MSKYEIKEKLDSSIYRLYNLLSNLHFSFSSYKKTVQVNIKFKDVHLGERCFILGTGPSLKDLNYNYLKNEITFGVNYLFKGDIINQIIPQYYCLYDDSFYYRHIQDTKDLIEKLPNTIFFLRTKAINAIGENKIKADNIFYQHCNLFQHDDYIKIDMTKNMTAPYNVVLGCIQTAIYMGFKEIYLLGCDYNSFASLNSEHFYDDDKSPTRNMRLADELKYFTLVTYHHYALNKYAMKNNIYIYNITPNSLLDAYSKKDIRDIIK